MKKLSKVVALLREADMKSKGVGASNLPQIDLLKELLYKIMN
jgi:DNA polymerase-3 subunit delta